MKDQETEITGSVDQGEHYLRSRCQEPGPNERVRIELWRTGTALNNAVTAYAALILADGLTGWKYDRERQQVLCCMYRLSVYATGGSAETDRAVITAAVKRLIARDISLPLTGEEYAELGVQE
jgi:hypothetical protein